MARITAYEATDGSLHRDRKAYLRHEANLLVAKELRNVIDKALADNPAARQAAADGDIHGFIVNGIGLNALRDLFALQFKPGSEDGDEPQAPAAAAPASATQPTGEGTASEI